MADKNKGCILDDTEIIEIADYLGRRHGIFALSTSEIITCYKTKQT